MPRKLTLHPPNWDKDYPHIEMYKSLFGEMGEWVYTHSPGYPYTRLGNLIYN